MQVLANKILMIALIALYTGNETPGSAQMSPHPEFVISHGSLVSWNHSQN